MEYKDIKISANFRPKKKKVILEKELEDGMVLYDPESEKIYSLNNTAAYIWTLCDGKKTFHKIIDFIRKDFDEFEDAPEKLVASTLEHFLKEGLIENNK